jgi:hypothetical protein
MIDSPRARRWRSKRRTRIFGRLSFSPFFRTRSTQARNVLFMSDAAWLQPSTLSTELSDLHLSSFKIGRRLSGHSKSGRRQLKRRYDPSSQAATFQLRARTQRCSLNVVWRFCRGPGGGAIGARLSMLVTVPIRDPRAGYSKANCGFSP